MKNLTEITAIVRAYLNDNAADVEQPILDSVNFLSNLFSIDSIDTSQSTVIGESTLDLPDNSLQIDTVFVDGEEVRKLKSLDDLDNVKASSEQRWYEFDGKIQFSIDFTAVETTEIFYKKGFKEPEAAVATDVPVTLLELVYTGAQYRYYNVLITKVVLNKTELPNLEPDELRRARKDVKDNFFELTKSIQLNQSDV